MPSFLRSRACAAAITLSCVSCIAVASWAQSHDVAPADSAAWSTTPFASNQKVANLALGRQFFVPNEGQWADSSVAYGWRAGDWSIALKDGGTIQLTLRKSEPAPAAPGSDACDALDPMSHREVKPQWSAVSSLTVSFSGCNTHARPIGINPTETRVNYFVGGKDRRGASGLSGFAGVEYPDLYPGIDLYVKGNEQDGSLKYEFHVAPGADPAQIRMNYAGLDQPLRVDAEGDLHIETSAGTLIDRAPIAYQVQRQSAARRSVAVSYRLDAHSDECRFDVGADYDTSSELVIDPDLLWMTYVGGSAGEQPAGLAIDASGNALITGYTGSSDFEGRDNEFHGGNKDAFLAQIDSEGRVQWMTFLGGSGDEDGFALAIDASGNIFVSGYTDSADFQGRNNELHGQEDAFVAQLTSSGELQWMTYLGGSDYDRGSFNGIAIDSSGNAVLTGYSESTDFEGRTNENHGNADAFIAVVDPNGQLQWMTYFGGTSYDGGYGIAIDNAGNLHVTGDTYSEDFEQRTNSFHGGRDDAFVAQLDPTGHVQWMTYIGGEFWETGYGIAVDASGNALVTGKTNSSDVEGRNNQWHLYYDAFAAKLNTSGQLQWLYYLGGSANDYGQDIALDAAGNILIAGAAESNEFEGRGNRNHGGNVDGFFAQLNPDGHLQKMIYLGGTAYDWAETIAVDAAGNAYVAGATYSYDFEGRNNISHGGAYEAFILKFGEGPRLTFTPDPLRENEVANFAGRHLTPNSPTYLAYSTIGIGSTYVPALNVTLDLAHPKQVGPMKMTDSDGNVVWTIHMPSVPQNVNLWIQACQHENKTSVVATYLRH